MFGYVNIDKGEMLVKDFDTYKAIYCSLCKQLGRDYSFLSRFILSYDCTFYALVILSLSDDCCGFCEGRCRFNPLKKCNYLKSGEKALSMASALSVTCAYYKLVDNIRDGGFFERLMCHILKPLFSHWNNKAKGKYPELEKAVCKMSEMQKKAEEDKACCVDKAAEPTALMLSDAMSFIKVEDETQRRVLSTFGYFLGKWIYLIDAAADISDDIKHNSFNPFVIKYEDPLIEIDDIDKTLNHCLSEVLLAYNLLSVKRFDRILRNIIELGLIKKQHIVLTEKQLKN